MYHVRSVPEPKHAVHMAVSQNDDLTFWVETDSTVCMYDVALLVVSSERGNITFPM